MRKLLLLSIVATLTSCSGKPAAPAGNTLYLSMWQGPKTFNSIVGNDQNSSEAGSWVFTSMVSTDVNTGLPKGELARSWDISADGRIVTFHLRSGLKFNDGSPLTAADVVFTFEKLVYDTAISCPTRDILVLDGKKPAVTAVDDSTVRFELATAFAPFVSAAGGVQILSSKHLASKTGAQFASTYGIDTSPDSLVGTGPWKLAKYEGGQRMIYVRNPYYWKKDSAGNALPRIDTIVYSFVQDQNADLLRFQTGETDMMEPISAKDFPVLKPKEAEGNYTLYRFGPSFRSSFVFFNQNTGKDAKTGKSYVDPIKQAWFRDVRFRKAVSFAIDRNALIQSAMNGLGKPGAGPFSPATGYWYAQNLPPLRKDLDSAKLLLKEAGFVLKDSTLYDAKGNKVKFTFVTNSENALRIQVAGMIRKDMEALGMEVMFTQLEFNALLEKFDKTNDWEMALLGLSGGGGDPHFSANAMLSSGRTTMWFPRQKKPSTPWEAEIDSLVKVGVTQLDTAARKRTYDRIQWIFREQQPVIYLEVPEAIAGARNKFEGLDPKPLGGLTHNLDMIRIRPTSK